METLFYVLGGALVLIALAVSALGMRSDDFPSTGVMRIGVLLIALVVAATAYGAVGSAQDEQEAREEEENREASLEAEETTEENEASGEVETPAPAAQGQGPGAVEPEVGAGTAGAGVEEGRAVFVEQGCGSCHTLADQGDQALGTIGPNLDVELIDEDAAFIETSIVEPSAFVVEGFGDNIMPSDYGEEIAPADLDALVAYLDEVAGAEGASGAGASGAAAGASTP